MPHSRQVSSSQALLGHAALVRLGLRPALAPLGGDQAGDHRVHGDAAGAQVLGQVLGDVVHRRVVQAVRHRRRQHAGAGDAADVDDAAGAVGRHDRQQRLRHAQHAERLDVDVVGPVGVGPGDLPLLALDRAAGVVHQDVDGTELGARPAPAAACTCASSRMSVGIATTRTPVALQISAAAASSASLPRASSTRCTPSSARRAGDVLADALAGPGDQRDASLEAQVHGVCRQMRPDPITICNYRNFSGSVSPATTSCRNSAALAPSTTRWSDESVIVICGWTPM